MAKVSQFFMPIFILPTKSENVDISLKMFQAAIQPFPLGQNIKQNSNDHHCSQMGICKK